MHPGVRWVRRCCCCYFCCLPSVCVCARRQQQQQRARVLRNTGELDLDNTSERICFLEAPSPLPFLVAPLPAWTLTAGTRPSIMSSDKITFLTNWQVTPYHAPLYLAQAKGFFQHEGIKVAILEPNDPSDVTEMIGTGKVDMGFKAMIHTLAAKAHGFPVVSVGRPAGRALHGRHLPRGIGHNGRLPLAQGQAHRLRRRVREAAGGRADGALRTEARRLHSGVVRYERGPGHNGRPHRCRHRARERAEMVELEEWLAAQGCNRADVKILRIDELAHLGCCCFCSVYIANEAFAAREPAKVRAFMRAVKRATDLVLAGPDAAWHDLVAAKPGLRSLLSRKVFERSFAYLSRDLKNVARDWDKVTRYGQRLGILGPDFVPNYTNRLLDWALDPDSADPAGDQHRMVELQETWPATAASAGCRLASALLEGSQPPSSARPGPLSLSRSRVTGIEGGSLHRRRIDSQINSHIRSCSAVLSPSTLSIRGNAGHEGGRLGLPRLRRQSLCTHNSPHR